MSDHRVHATDKRGAACGEHTMREFLFVVGIVAIQILFVIANWPIWRSIRP